VVQTNTNPSLNFYLLLFLKKISASQKCNVCQNLVVLDPMERDEVDSERNARQIGSQLQCWAVVEEEKLPLVGVVPSVDPQRVTRHSHVGVGSPHLLPSDWRRSEPLT
jgi:hypothetical protein